MLVDRVSKNSDHFFMNFLQPTGGPSGIKMGMKSARILNISNQSSLLFTNLKIPLVYNFLKFFISFYFKENKKLSKQLETIDLSQQISSVSTLKKIKNCRSSY